jgi:hypothetical protein
MKPCAALEPKQQQQQRSHNSDNNSYDLPGQGFFSFQESHIPGARNMDFTGARTLIQEPW